MNKRIIIFDDNDQRRDGLALLISLTSGMECVGTFRDCSNVLEHLATCKPDLVLMDIDMPHVNGIEGVKLIRTIDNDVVILMQTVFEDDEKVFDSIRAGANGYILKKVSPSELIRAMEEALAGGAPMTPSIARQVLNFVQTTESRKKNTEFKLTQREQEILQLLVQGFSYKMVSERCQITLTTVNSHIQNIYSKLQVNSAIEAVTKAIESNIL